MKSIIHTRNFRMNIRKYSHKNFELREKEYYKKYVNIFIAKFNVYKFKFYFFTISSKIFIYRTT